MQHFFFTVESTFFTTLREVRCTIRTHCIWSRSFFRFESAVSVILWSLALPNIFVRLQIFEPFHIIALRSKLTPSAHQRASTENTSLPQTAHRCAALKDKVPCEFVLAVWAPDALGAPRRERRVALARLVAGPSSALARARARAL